MYDQNFWVCVDHECMAQSDPQNPIVCSCGGGDVSYVVSDDTEAGICDAGCVGSGGCERRPPLPYSARSGGRTTGFHYPSGHAPEEATDELEALGFPAPGDPDGPNKHLSRDYLLLPQGNVWLDAVDADGIQTCARIRLFKLNVTRPRHPVRDRLLYLGHELKVNGGPPTPCPASDRVVRVEQIRDADGAVVPGFYHVKLRGMLAPYIVRTEHDLVPKP